jgi:hypothetical protein
MFKFQQELVFVASLGDVPEFIWDIMPCCLAIEASYIAIFESENLNIG